MSRRHQIFWAVVVVGLLSFGGAWGQVPIPQPVEPIEPVADPLPPGTGFIPPNVDLSHMEQYWQFYKPISQVTYFDWRNNSGNYITSVKNQGACGACYSFASLGNFESKILIDGGSTFDLSENHAKECYYVPPVCAGGDNYQMACLFSQTGTQLESDNGYVAAPDSCWTGAGYPYQQTVLDWCSINGATNITTTVLKNYIINNGPIYTTLFVGIGPPTPDAWYNEFSTYDGSYGMCNMTVTGTVNHAVLVVGWDDNQPYDIGHDGSIDGYGCWIVKNSWGTGWGGPCGVGSTGGYFYYAYGSTAADFGQWCSFIDRWQPYDSNGGLLSFDDAGAWGLDWSYSSTTAWELCRFTVGSDVLATAIEFWTNDQTTDVDVYLYDGFNTSTGTLGTLLTSSLNHSYTEPGYHSVSITPTNIGPSSNPEAVAVVKITNSMYTSPIPADWGKGTPPLETNRCYMSPSGANGSWYQTSTDGTYPSDLGVRIRTTLQIDTPTPTETAFETATSTPTETATETPTETGTATPTETATPLTPIDTETPTATPTETETPLDVQNWTEF